jgi:hypothetical protein
MLKRISATIIHEETVGCNKFHNKELRDIFSSSNTFRMIRSRRNEGEGNVANDEKTKIY